MEDKQRESGVTRGRRRSQEYRYQASLKGKSMAEALSPDNSPETFPADTSCFSQEAWLDYYTGGLRSKHLYKRFRKKKFTPPSPSNNPRPPVPSVFDTECTIIPEVLPREASLVSVGSRIDLSEDVDLRPPFSCLLHHLKSNGEVDLGAWKTQSEIEPEQQEAECIEPSNTTTADENTSDTPFTTNSKHIAVNLHPKSTRHQKNGKKWLLLSAIVVTTSILIRGR